MVMMVKIEVKVKRERLAQQGLLAQLDLPG